MHAAGRLRMCTGKWIEAAGQVGGSDAAHREHVVAHALVDLVLLFEGVREKASHAAIASTPRTRFVDAVVDLGHLVHAGLAEELVVPAGECA